MSDEDMGNVSNNSKNSSNSKPKVSKASQNKNQTHKNRAGESSALPNTSNPVAGGPSRSRNHGSGKGQGTCSLCGGGKSRSEEIPITSFSQDNKSVEYMIECTYENLSKDSWSIGIAHGDILTVKLVVKPPKIWMAQIKLPEKLTDSTVTCNQVNKYREMVVMLKKSQPYNWKSIGTPLKYHNRILSSFETPDEFYPAKIMRRSLLAAGQYEYQIKTESCVRFGVPVGWCMIFEIPGLVDRRAYTPVTITNTDKGQNIIFIIKLHDHGKFTQKLHKLPLERIGVLHIGSVGGFFDTDFLLDTDRLLLLAGGTGIAPFVGLVNFLQKHRKSRRVKQVILILCARTEAELVWNQTWKEIVHAGKSEEIDGDNLHSSHDSLLQKPNNDKWFFYYPYVTSRTRDSEYDVEFMMAANGIHPLHSHEGELMSQSHGHGHGHSLSHGHSQGNKGYEGEDPDGHGRHSSGPGPSVFERRINTDFVRSIMDKIKVQPPNPFSPMRIKGMGCGPIGFTGTCRTIFRSLGIKLRDIFTFDEN